MSKSLNKAMLIGNVGAEPEVRETGGGTKVATVSLATNRRWTDRQGQEQERTEWHRLVFWEGAAEVIERYVDKGDRLYAEGQINYRQWEGDDGQTRYTTEIRVREFILLGSGRRYSEGDGQGGGQNRQPQPAGPAGGDEAGDDAWEGDDDLPF